MLAQALEEIPNIDFKLSLNRPSGNFFYDAWEIKDEFKGTVWETLLNTLPAPYGEARLIRLKPGACYTSHADIDDRYHLNLTGVNCYLINLDNTKMYPLVNDLTWYELSAGVRHSAANFGYTDRIQLVVRKLLRNNTITNPMRVTLTSALPQERARYVFDDTLSLWLNSASKLGWVSDFAYTSSNVTFTIEKNIIDIFKLAVPEEFTYDIFPV